MTRRLHRYYGAGYLHFITSSCYRRQPHLGTARGRSLFLEILEQVRCRYDFVIIGYVIRPEHLHLLISEPERGNPSMVMQVLKQRFAHRLLTWWRKQQTPDQPACGRRPSRPATSGSAASMTSWSGANASGWRN